MSGISLHSHDIAFLQVQLVDIVIVSLACMLELHLHQVCCFVISWHVSKPVISVELLVLSAYRPVA